MTSHLLTMHFVAPSTIIAYLFVTRLISWVFSKRSSRSSVVQFRYMSTVLLFILSITSIGQVLLQQQSRDTAFYLLSWFVLSFYMILLILDDPSPAWYSYFGCWILGSLFEGTEIGILEEKPWTSGWIIPRIKILVFLSLIVCAVLYWRKQPLYEVEFEEGEPLLGDDRNIGPDVSSIIATIYPVLWPCRDRKYRLYFLGMLVIMAIQRLVTWLLTRQLGFFIDAVQDYQSRRSERFGLWPSITGYFVLVWLNSAAGLDLIQSIVQLPIEQFTYKQITLTAFENLVNLDIEHRVGMDSNEILSSIQRGTSLQELLALLFLECGPLVFDLGFACIYIYTLLDEFILLAVISTASLSVWISFKMTLWTMKRRDENNESFDKLYKIQSEAIQNWQLVIRCGTARYEIGQLNKAASVFLSSERVYYLTYAVGAAVQSFPTLLGRVIAVSWAVKLVINGTASIGALVTLLQFLTLWERNFSRVSKSIQKGISMLTDANKLAQLLQKTAKVVDSPNASPLAVSAGHVEFKNVCFSYTDSSHTLTDVSVEAAPGQMVALVGPSGSGKSTIATLLVRGYDVQSGEICIDGHDISKVTLESLRKAVESAQQEHQLFNRSIDYNVAYGHPTSENVETACKIAAIHSKIESLGAKYQSVVGERGVNLSGGKAASWNCPRRSHNG